MSSWFEIGVKVFLVLLMLAGLAWTRKSVTALAFVLIFFMPAGAVFLLLDRRASKPLWRWMYAAGAALGSSLYFNALRPAWLHPVEAWVTSIWIGGLLTAAFFWLPRLHRPPSAPSGKKERIVELLRGKGVDDSQMLVSCDGKSGVGLNPAMEKIFLARQGKSYPQEIHLKDLLSVLMVENGVVLGESSAPRMASMTEFKHLSFRHFTTPARTNGKVIESLELRIAVADFVEPILTVQFVVPPVKKGSPAHESARAQAFTWFRKLDEQFHIKGFPPRPVNQIVPGHTFPAP